MKRWVTLLTACAVCIEWTKLKGTVKAIDQMHSTITIVDRNGGLLKVPMDYQVQIIDKHGEIVTSFKRLKLDNEVTLINTPMEPPPKEEETPFPEHGENGH